jgi:hypothetical protein
MEASSNKGRHVYSAIAATALTSLVVASLAWAEKRRRRAEYVEKERIKLLSEEGDEGEEALPSVMQQFQGLQLDYDVSIGEANKRRTANYYEKARDAHMYDLVVGVRSYPRLRNRRERVLKKLYKYYNGQTKKSHRTVIVMCDDETQTILLQARMEILAPLKVSHDIATDGVWIPAANLIPQRDLHVTVAIPWWWHSIRDGNAELSRQIAARFRQALVVNMHHPFQIELEKIVLLGGSTLVALWRCIGERVTENGHVIYDRHGETIDPFVALRRDIVRSFATEDLFEPLTYYHNTTTAQQSSSTNVVTPPPPPPPQRGKLERSNTIEIKTPGLGDHDGFIHTTLARLPLDCLSMTDVELAPIHRLCRETTATYCGHRMVIDRYRFLETTGAGGESNPCPEPLFDETVEAPTRVFMDGVRTTEMDLHVSKNVESSSTIGAIRDSRTQFPRLDSLFAPDNSVIN